MIYSPEPEEKAARIHAAFNARNENIKLFYSQSLGGWHALRTQMEFSADSAYVRISRP